MVQSDYLASKTEQFREVQTETVSSETGIPANGIYDPFLLFSAEANFSFSVRIPRPQVSDKSQDQFSKDTQNRASHPNNTTSFIVSTNQIDVGLPIEKLIFPFHSFL